MKKSSGPQFQLGATSADAVEYSKLPGPGGISRQFELPQNQSPRASVDSQINRDGHGSQNG